MQGASGLAKDTYKFVAVSLTLASVCTALAQVMQVTSLTCMQLLAHISTQLTLVQFTAVQILKSSFCCTNPFLLKTEKTWTVAVKAFRVLFSV